jgi:hypothetical protein
MAILNSWNGSDDDGAELHPYPCAACANRWHRVCRDEECECSCRDEGVEA